MCRNIIKLNTRLVALLAVVLLLVGVIPAVSAAETSGKCGNDLSWTFDGSTLTITGSGDMYDYRESTKAPWYEYREKITAVKLPDGLTSVGNLAFYGCTSLASVIVPNSVVDIGWHAFDGCTGLTILNLGSGLKIIGEGTFRECVSLRSLRLPQSLTTIGYQAFARCETLTTVTVPASVTTMGAAVFSFCYSLIRAEILAPLEELPTWTFYGCGQLTELALSQTVASAEEYAFYDCDSLNIVSHIGTDANREQIRQDIARDTGDGLVTVAEDPLENSTTGTSITEDDGDIIASEVTTVQTPNASVSTEVTITYPEDDTENGETEIRVDITLENADGWTEAQQQLEQSVLDSGSVQVNVYIKDESAISGEAVDALAGDDNSVTIHSASGEVWKVEGEDLSDEVPAESYSFSFQRADATAEQLAKMGVDTGYQLIFLQDAQINAQVLIRLPVDLARSAATLYQVENNELKQLQSVVVDGSGYAHFFLGAVWEDTQYLIGINVPGISSDSLIVPEELYGEYGITDLSSPVEYVITGRTSSWGMSGWQVGLILGGVMLVCIVGIGVFMYAQNKRKLKMGYIPELDDEDENQ